jgi:hypothetical protein
MKVFLLADTCLVEDNALSRSEKTAVHANGRHRGDLLLAKQEAVDALNGPLSRDGTFTALAIVAAVSAVWTALYTARMGPRVPAQAVRIPSSR